MIVRACDTCRKLLPDSCALVAMRDLATGAVMFKKDGAARRGSHFCTPECAIAFFQDWLEDKLPAPAPVPVAAEQEPVAVAPPALPVRQPTREEVAEQNAILGLVLR